ncbi:MAG TPA: calcium-binding protein [Polaromonas sp.]|uniref:calcium-binding protein n=1 Tax=Polaromonas sp. TaxID=1869339 RepID=UPI002D231ED5|nr:calcium-binding protein [Polaromonas sp.]HYW57020.1 calcium-binding protein [Polaromonas sp.]
MSYTPTPTSGDDVITGDAENDIIDALEGNDIIYGGGGDDELRGGLGNDSLYGQAGNDRLLGGSGDDRYEIDRTDTITEQAGEGNDSVYFRDDSFTGTYVLPANVENLTLIGRFNNLSASGNDGDNRILGNNTGNDTLNGGAGNDYIEGDYAYFYGSNSFSSSTGDDVVHGGDGNDVIWGDQSIGSGGGNDVLYGDAGNDQLNGQRGVDTLHGGSGDDVLDGGGDSDVLYGGAGDDDYLFGRNSGLDQVVETAVAGEANQVRFAAGIAPSEVQVTHEGDDLHFYINGAQNNKLSIVGYFTAANKPVTEAVFGDGTVWSAAVFDSAPVGPPGDGDLVIQGTSGPDTLSGRGGNDTIDGLGSADNIYGGSGNDYLLGGPGNDNLLGEAGDDVLDGGVDNDSIYGGAGNDTLRGDQGSDFLVGGAGNDLLDGGVGRNTYLLQRGDGQDVIRSGTFDSGSEIRLGFYNDQTPGATNRGLLTGEITLTRLNNDLVLAVNGTADTIRVEGYFANAASGVYPDAEISFQDGTWGTDEINANVQSGPPPSGTATDGNDVLTGTSGDDAIFAQGADDQLTGGAGNDFLNGELGNDSMAGGTGNDEMVVNSLGDQVTENAGEGIDTVQSYISYTLTANVENLVLIGDEGLMGNGNTLANRIIGNTRDNVLSGSDGNDVLYGHSGNDFLNGELGQDQMFGGLGSDTMIVNDIGDFVWEAANEGTDTVQSYISHTLQDNFENLTLIGQTGVVAKGNTLANVIQGNDSNNSIDGMGGLDTMVGNGGDDILTIHSGQELVAGGSGADTLHLAADLGFLNLSGLAGTSLTGIEGVDMGNGSATTVRMSMAQMLALSAESNTLIVDGDAGDELQIGTDWRREASATAGYDQYSSTSGTETGVLLVGQAVTVTMADWVA